RQPIGASSSVTVRDRLPRMPSQRPFFLSTFFAAFRQPAAASASSSLSSAAASSSQQPPNKQVTSSGTAGSAPRTISSAAGAGSQSSSSSTSPGNGGVIAQLSPRHGGIPIPQASQSPHTSHGRRRGSDSSSEGFREVIGADKLYIGGRTAAGEEKFFRLGVVRRVRSGDRLSLDRLSL
ncbi:hypothetical protein QBC46DRAFT_273364, partial [Diplogelasinospora grovesii]